MRLILPLVALLALPLTASAATLSKLPDILENADQPVTTDTLNRALLDLMRQREAVHEETDLDKLAPAAGAESSKAAPSVPAFSDSYPSPSEQ